MRGRRARQQPAVEGPADDRHQDVEVARHELHRASVCNEPRPITSSTPASDERRADDLGPRRVLAVEERADGEHPHRHARGDQGHVERRRGHQRQVLQRVVGADAEQPEPPAGKASAPRCRAAGAARASPAAAAAARPAASAGSSASAAARWPTSRRPTTALPAHSSGGSVISSARRGVEARHRSSARRQRRRSSSTARTGRRSARRKPGTPSAGAAGGAARPAALRAASNCGVVVRSRPRARPGRAGSRRRCCWRRRAARWRRCRRCVSMSAHSVASARLGACGEAFHAVADASPQCAWPALLARSRIAYLSTEETPP